MIAAKTILCPFILKGKRQKAKIKNKERNEDERTG
jgi:hypothetical protein